MLERLVASMVCLAAWFAAPAGAQVSAPGAGFYGGFGLGSADHDVPGAADKEDTGWKLFGGYQFNRNVAIEGGYVDLGRAIFPGTSLESTALTLSAVGSLPMTDQFAFTGKLGIAWAETDVAGFGTRDSTDPVYGLGLRYDFNKQFGVRGEWERFRLNGSPLVGKFDADLFSINAIVRFY